MKNMVLGHGPFKGGGGLLRGENVVTGEIDLKNRGKGKEDIA